MVGAASFAAGVGATTGVGTARGFSVVVPAEAGISCLCGFGVVIVVIAAAGASGSDTETGGVSDDVCVVCVVGVCGMGFGITNVGAGSVTVVTGVVVGVVVVTVGATVGVTVGTLDEVVGCCCVEPDVCSVAGDSVGVSALSIDSTDSTVSGLVDSPVRRTLGRRVSLSDSVWLITSGKCLPFIILGALSKVALVSPATASTIDVAIKLKSNTNPTAFFFTHSRFIIFVFFIARHIHPVAYCC